MNNENRRNSDRIKISFLVENKTDNPGIIAEHGLSIYIETSGLRILFDAGATNILIQNAEKMGINLADVDLAVVSHGHYDHTGGFPAFCRINDRTPIYIHRDAFRESYSLRGGRLHGSNDGIRWTAEEKAEIDGRLVKTDGPFWITDDICVTGSIVKEKGFIPSERFYYRDEDGNIAEDDMSHEQCLVIRRSGGLYIFSGCSHTGVISAMETAKGLFPGEKIAMLVAGMHLYSAADEVRENVVKRVAAEAPECVMPVHCTGIKAICDLRSMLGDACIVATAGDSYGGC